MTFVNWWRSKYGPDTADVSEKDYSLMQSAFEAGQANPPEGFKRKIFICSECEGIYADAPVSQCDCSNLETVFIEGVATYG